MQSYGLQNARLHCSLLLLEFAQIHVHWVSDTIQPSNPLLPPSPLALSFSQHQGLLHWVSSSYQWPEYWHFSFSIGLPNEYWFPLGLTGLISLLSKGLSEVFCNTTNLKASILQHSAFFIHTWLLELINSISYRTITINSISKYIWCLPPVLLMYLSTCGFSEFAI